MKLATKTPKELESTISAISNHLAEIKDYEKMMDEVGGAPSVYLEKHGIAVPDGITINCVRVFSTAPKTKKADSTKVAKKKKDKYIGEATWNNGHYICRVYERPNGTQYEVCWCR
ncbi:MAG: hypothetical protein JNJ50_23965 [Acidobacteria bacterium]|nr:hypothetical protein [Acidobacteriota bacterium]